MGANLFIPQGRRNDVHRPLNGGIRLDAPSQALQKDEFYDLQDVYIEPGGVRRRHTAQAYAASAQVDYPPIKGIYSFWKTNGAQVTTVLDTKFLYLVTASGLTGQYWTYSTGTITVSSTTVTGSGTTWTGTNILEGDIMVLDANGSGDGPERVIIDSVDDNTTITLKAAATGTYGGGTDYIIRRAIQYDAYDSFPIVATIPGKMYIADGTRVHYSYDGTTFASTGISYIAATIEFFGDRMWIAHTVESGNTYRYRIRWTDVGSGNWETFPADNWLDLPYFQGRFRRLKAMSDAMIAYGDDSVWFGLPTQLPSLPLAFRQRGNQNQGIVGQMAVTAWSDGQFFVSQDDIYLITARELKPIGTAVVKGTIDRCRDLSAVWAETDYRNSRAVFGFPIDGDNPEVLWSYYWKTNSWARELRPCTALSAESIIESIVWTDLNVGGILAASTWSGGFTNYPTWSSLRGEETERRLYFGNQDILTYFEGPGTADYDSIIPLVVLETGDLDYGIPDVVKTWTGLTIKLDKGLDNAQTFNIEGSIKRGEASTWKNLGTLSIAALKDEGKVNFRLTGDTGRFRVTYNGTEDLMFTEINLMWKPMGSEIPSRTS